MNFFLTDQQWLGTGDFDEWQTWQTRRNFEREFVLSLIQLPERNKWLFAPGLVRGREQSAIIRAMKPRSGSASLAETSWCT